MDPVWTKNMYALYNYTYKEHYDIFIGLYMGIVQSSFPKRNTSLAHNSSTPIPGMYEKYFRLSFGFQICEGVIYVPTYVLPIIIIHEFGFFFLFIFLRIICQTPHLFGFMELRQILEISLSEKQKKKFYRSYD